MNELAKRNTIITTLAGSHGKRLHRYLASRLRHARRDVPDLVQEVFLRLSRVPRPDTIRNPEAYLFTIANHVAVLPVRAQAALVLYRRAGCSLEEIAQRLGVSRGMVKKYVAKATLHCRSHIPMEQ